MALKLKDEYKGSSIHYGGNRYEFDTLKENEKKYLASVGYGYLFQQEVKKSKEK